MRRLLALIVAICACVSTASARAQAGAEISGTVVLADSPSTPVRHARVTIAGPDGSNMLTDDTGRFVFTGLQAGKYLLAGSKPGYATSKVGAPDVADEPLQIALAPGQRVTNLQLLLARGSVITGAITDRDGAPVAGAIVSASLTFGIVSRFRPAATATSNDDGSYRLFGLNSGDYVVSAAFDKARTYYPSVTSANNTSVVTVAAAEERVGIDIVMRPNSNTTITGTVTSSDGQPAVGVDLGIQSTIYTRMALPIHDLDEIESGLNGAGIFTFKNVPPGSYTIQAQRGSTSPLALERGAPEFEMASAVITVDGQPVDGISLTLQRGTTVSGRLQLDSNGKLDGSVEVRVMGDSGTTTRSASAFVGADGAWTIRGVMPGRYRLVSSPAEAGGAARKIRSATLNGRDVLDTPFDVGTEPIKGIDVTMTDKLGSVRGRLTDSAGAAATNYRIVVFPTDRALWSLTSRAALTQAPDSNGDWTIPNLLPGEYRVAAVGGRGVFIPTPELLEQLSAASAPTIVTIANTVVVNLQVGR